MLASMVLVAGSARAQSTQDAGNSWLGTVDNYLAGNNVAAAAVLALPPQQVAQAARDAMEGWTSRVRAVAHSPGALEERRLAIRRFQASALLPLEILLPLSVRDRVSDSMRPFEHIAIDAWERLADFETLQLDVPGDAGLEARERRIRLERFREWWRTAFLQYLLNVRRHADFRQLAALAGVPARDPRAAAETLLLQGIYDETSSRLVPSAPSHPAAAMRMPESRLRAVNMALAEAITSYRRALERVPDHREARLRLGRALLDRDRADEALRTLEPLRAPRCDDSICALAALFAGEAHEAGGRRDEAGLAYARASSVLAVRQSALLALMQLAFRRGAPAAALGISGQFLGTSPLSTYDEPDAWSLYIAGRRTDAEAVLGPLREAVEP